MTADPTRWCSHCGAQLLINDGNPRCPQGHDFYQPRPQILVSCFVSCGSRLLWMRRNNEPQRGYWAIPAGYMEANETLAEAAARELREETCVEIEAGELSLYMAGTISYISQIYIAFRGSVASECGRTGPEASEIGWFSRDELDWSQVAYPDANNAIECAYDDLQRGEFPLRHSIMDGQRNLLTPVRRN